MNSREGVKHGDSLYMVAYGIGIIPLIKKPKAEVTDVTHTWYADDDTARGAFANVDLYFNSLKRFAPKTI